MDVKITVSKKPTKSSRLFFIGLFFQLANSLRLRVRLELRDPRAEEDYLPFLGVRL